MEEVLYKESDYTLIEDYREGYNLEEIELRFTDYFKIYDYLIGDWSYGKLRLKGFYKEGHKNCRELNNYKNLQSYITKNCAFDCRYFVIEKK